MAGVVRIAMVAGEPSGDLLASHLIAALKAKLPNAVFFGIGGPKMQGQGFDAWWPMESLSVMGYVDALKNYREISGIRRQLKKRLLDQRPDIFIGVDAPDFNLGLETSLKSAGGANRSLRQSLDLGLARRSHQENRSRGQPCSGAVSHGAAALRKSPDSGDLCRPSAG